MSHCRRLAEMAIKFPPWASVRDEIKLERNNKSIARGRVDLGRRCDKIYIFFDVSHILPVFIKNFFLKN